MFILFKRIGCTPFFVVFSTIIMFSNCIAQAAVSSDMEEYWNSSSSAEKIELRAKIAREHPDSDEGLMARAGLAMQDGRDAEVKKLYSECLDRFSESPYCATNYLYLGYGTTEERQALAKRMIALDARFDSFEFYDHLYCEYKLANNQAAANALLEEARLKYPGEAAAARMEIEGAFLDRDYSLAALKIRNLIQSGEGSKYLYTFYAEALIRGLPNMADKSQDEQKELLKPVYEKIKSLPGISDPKLGYTVAMTMASELGTQKAHAWIKNELYLIAYKTLPKPDPIQLLFASFFDELPEYDFEANESIRMLLADAVKRFPKNYEVSFTQGRVDEIHGRRDDALRCFKKALKLAITDKQKVQSATWLADLTEKTQGPDAAKSVLNGALSEVNQLSPVSTNLLNEIYKLELGSGDYQAALKSFTDYELRSRRDIKNVNNAWFNARRRQLLTFIDEEKQSAENIPARMAIAEINHKIVNDGCIDFSVGSSELSPDAKTRLDALAPLLLKSAQAGVHFGVAGLKAPGEKENDFQARLAANRVKAVIQYLNQKIGISGSFFSELNATPTPAGAIRPGVRIMAIPAIYNNQVSPITALNPGNILAISPDGRLLVTGKFKMELWSLETGTKLFDLGRGNNAARFSPDSRYVAVRSSFTSAGMITCGQIIIYETSTGRVVWRRVENDFNNFTSLSAFSWAPDSRKLVFAEGATTLKILDLAQHRIVKTVDLPTNHLVNALLWTKGGKIISTQAVDKTLLVFDADTLKMERELEGVDWPFIVAETYDGHFMMAVDNNKTLSVWDTEKWQLYQQVNIGLFHPDIATSPNKHTIAMTDKFNKLELVDLDTMEVKFGTDDLPDGLHGVAFEPEGRYLLVTGNNSIDIRSAKNGKYIDRISSPVSAATCGTSVPNHGLFLTCDASGIHSWDVTTGEEKHHWNLKASSLWSVDSKSSIFAAIKADKEALNTDIWLIDTSVGIAPQKISTSHIVDDVAVTGDFILVFARPFVEVDDQSPKGTVETYSRKTGKKLLEWSVGLVTKPLSYEQALEARFDGVAVNPEGSRIAILTSWIDGFGRTRVYSDNVRLFSSDGEAKGDIHGIAGAHGLAFHDVRTLAITTDYFTQIYDIETNKNVERTPYITGEILASRGKKEEMVYNIEMMELRNKENGSIRYRRENDDLLAAGLFEAQGRIAEVTYLNEIRLLRKLPQK